MYKKVWNKQLFNDQIKRQNAGNKLRTYRTFKTNIKQEKYTQILDQKQRQILCKFRISTHDLDIEKGRYCQMEPEKRICKLCNVEVEDEMHFFLKCPKLEERRSAILNSIYLKYEKIPLLNTNKKLVWLMSAEDWYILRNISKLLIALFSERDRLLHINNKNS